MYLATVAAREAGLTEALCCARSQRSLFGLLKESERTFARSAEFIRMRADGY
jgi:hypothetical protein